MYAWVPIWGLLTEGSGLKSQRKKTVGGEFLDVMRFILRMVCTNHRISKKKKESHQLWQTVPTPHIYTSDLPPTLVKTKCVIVSTKHIKTYKSIKTLYARYMIGTLSDVFIWETNHIWIFVLNSEESHRYKYGEHTSWDGSWSCWNCHELTTNWHALSPGRDVSNHSCPAARTGCSNIHYIHMSKNRKILLT